MCSHFYLVCCLVDVLQEELTELELPADPMEKVFVKLAELKQVRNLTSCGTCVGQISIFDGLLLVDTVFFVILLGFGTHALTFELT